MPYLDALAPDYYRSPHGLDCDCADLKDYNIRDSGLVSTILREHEEESKLPGNEANDPSNKSQNKKMRRTRLILPAISFLLTVIPRLPFGNHELQP
jgi:hypothetical protein